jgi:hypothetical protein
LGWLLLKKKTTKYMSSRKFFSRSHFKPPIRWLEPFAKR